MSRLTDLFNRKNRKVLNMYCTAGFPQLDSTLTVMRALQESGADIIELGMPYSDPLADGPVIQHSSTVALQNGMNLQTLFRQLENFRTHVHVPVLLMGYLNPLLQYGFEKFCAAAAAVGVDGLIIPDIPAKEYEVEYSPILKQHGLDFIFLITPETTDDRICKLDKLSSGFLYAVSSSAITGTAKKMDHLKTYIARLNKLKLKNPVLVGFGVKDKESFEAASEGTAGAIIGSAYINMLNTSINIDEDTKAFIEHIVK